MTCLPYRHENPGSNPQHSQQRNQAKGVETGRSMDSVNSLRACLKKLKWVTEESTQAILVYAPPTLTPTQTNIHYTDTYMKDKTGDLGEFFPKANNYLFLCRKNK